MYQQNMTAQPFINLSAFGRSLGMWLVIWGAMVFLVTYGGQPGVVCLTPLAWLLALPAGWNYVIFAQGRPGRQPFVAGVLLGASLGLLYGLLFFGVAVYGMPVGSDPAEVAKNAQPGLLHDQRWRCDRGSAQRLYGLSRVRLATPWPSPPCYQSEA